MADTSITIKDIRVFAHHGVLPEEKADGQEFRIDVEMVLEEGTAAVDDLSATVDYAEVARAVASIATSERYELIETLAAEIVDHLLALEGVRSAEVTVRKLNAPLPVEAGWVGVTVRSERQ